VHLFRSRGQCHRRSCLALNFIRHYWLTLSGSYRPRGLNSHIRFGHPSPDLTSRASVLILFLNCRRREAPWASIGRTKRPKNAFLADARNFYKVERWTRDGLRVDRMLYAGNNLKSARDIFAKAIKHRPRIRLTIRQRTRVLDLWPATDESD